MRTTGGAKTTRNRGKSREKLRCGTGSVDGTLKKRSSCENPTRSGRAPRRKCRKAPVVSRDYRYFRRFEWF
ncbi:MAG: hypothetical protein DMF62_12835 [Acidobacteria bacterium]|nr:MAG: hypothetical protein DMF62_12835 [Acidobacteriota bacterium]